MTEKCPTNACTREAVVPGFYRFSDDDAGSETSYCRNCATELWVDNFFHPHNLFDLQDGAPEPSMDEARVLDRFETSSAAPESFDARAAILRVQALADRLERETPAPQGDAYLRTAQWIRHAIAGESA